MANFLTAEWRKLIMAQYVVAPETLAPYLPPGVALDLYRVGDEARCYVSLVGFLFDRVKLKGVPVPFHRRFEEVNLRFYVTRTEASGEVKRGVVFIGEIVPKSAIAIVARVFYEEPYSTMPTAHSFKRDADTLRVSYEWRHRGLWQSLAVEADANAQAIGAGSEEEFITEHYWGYTKRTRGGTSVYAVEHPRWTIYPIRRCRIAADFGGLYGPAFASLTHTEPASVLLAEGSAVSVGAGSRHLACGLYRGVRGTDIRDEDLDFVSELTTLNTWQAARPLSPLPDPVAWLARVAEGGASPASGRLDHVRKRWSSYRTCTTPNR